MSEVWNDCPLCEAPLVCGEICGNARLDCSNCIGYTVYLIKDSANENNMYIFSERINTGGFVMFRNTNQTTVYTGSLNGTPTIDVDRTLSLDEVKKLLLLS